MRKDKAYDFVVVECQRAYKGKCVLECGAIDCGDAGTRGRIDAIDVRVLV